MLLARDGWDVTVVTVFTRSVANPEGFSLACQLDKGLPADADYMAIRREEDREFCRRSGLPEPSHLDLLEAPHRGYTSAADLFGGIHADDQVTVPSFTADLVFGPQGLGNHVDHLHVAGAMVQYQDAPYAIRICASSPVLVDTSRVREQKLWAIEAYATQIPFQFGSVAAMRQMLGDWEERFTATDKALLRQWSGFRFVLEEDTPGAR